MYTIVAHFRPFAELHIGDLFGQNGVYVLWDGRAIAKPTYIGEGNVLKRFADHVRRDIRKFAHPIDGYVALFGPASKRFTKTEALVVERLILDVARETDREPAVNVRPGAGVVVRLLCEKAGTLRVALHGDDPLTAPWNRQTRQGIREIKARLNRDDHYEIEHNWRMRRVRAPVV